MYELRQLAGLFINFGENWLGIVGAKTRMIVDVKVRGRNHLLEMYADGTALFSRSVPIGLNTINKKCNSFNCELRPDQG